MHDPLSMTLSALADPTRRAILDRLAEGEATVTDLARPFQLSQPTISKHLKVLEAAGLISQGRAAQSRPRKLEAGPLKQLSEWMDRYRQHWEASFDQLDQYLTELQRTNSGVDGHE